MRAYWLSLALLLAVPAAAADPTETIALHYLAVSEVEKMLSPSDGVASVGLIRLPKLVPEGLTAWTANPATNALTLTGKREAIDQLKKILRLLDIPPRQIRLEVQVLRLKAEALAQVEKLLPEAKGVEPVVLRAALLDRKTVRELTEGAAAQLANADLPTANQRPFYVRWVEEPEAATNLLTLIPRLNGDGTVTVMLPTEVARRQDGAVMERNVAAIRRMQVGQTVLTLPRAGGPAVLVTYRSLMPDAAPGEGRRGAPVPMKAEAAP